LAYSPAPGRRGAIDVARSAALVLVVLGHLAMAVIDRGANGAVRGANLLALEPGVAWLAMLAPMPVFFAAAGWANATATAATAAARLRTLVGLGAVVVVTWSTLSIAELLLRGEGGVVADGARISTQPLWFLAAYVPFTALGTRLARVATRPVLAVGGSLVALALLDAARFTFDAPEAVGWPGFFLAWGVPWVLGAWWRSRCEAGGLRENRTGAIVAVAALAVAAALVLLGGYSPALIDAVPGQRSNTTPPGLYTATAAMVQVGLLMVLARRLDGLAARRRRLLDQAGTASVGIYAWHLTALSLCAAAIAAGLWAPGRFSTGWWLSRPLWFTAVLGLTGALVAITTTLRARLQRGGVTSTPRRPLGRLSVISGVVCSTVGAGVIGLRGPRTLPAAIVSIVAFVAGWWLLRAADTLRPTQGGTTSAPV
jgi:fucose 4-O-acetylase-like acetyltransferase